MRYLYFIMVFVFLSCKQESKQDEEVVSKTKISDGTHCADVTYYNPNTGTKNTYTLNVEVDNNELTKIYWGNGGWLDDSHFKPEELDKDGYCSFTSDRGYKYKVDITGSKCSTTDNPTEDVKVQKPAYKLTLGDCASALQMTEEELVEYENFLEKKRTDAISEKSCETMQTYITQTRPIKKSMDNMNRQINDGFVQSTYSRSNGDNVWCRHTVVKRHGLYYLLEVNSSEISPMGFMEFNPDIVDWQDVIITQDISKTEKQIFQMRIIEQSTDLNSLKAQAERYCN